MEKRKEGKLEIKRKPFQGVWNILLFNWHYYAILLLFIVLAVAFAHLFPAQFLPWKVYILAFVTLSSLISLIVSYWIYDRTDLYSFPLIEHLDNKQVLNIHAGFDETSALIQSKFPSANLTIADFYDPLKHREVSIKRARKRYPNSPLCKAVNPLNLSYQNNSFDCILVIFAAHEIRNEEERAEFFKELKRVLKPEGEIVVMEHRRDWLNFLAYQIGFLHFYSDRQWRRTFKEAALNLVNATKQYGLITTYKLKKYGTSH